ncbi:MAG: hypothetical protein IT287_05595 [Bdellovibrionaceae bacterium]|nr:hypothetical protein [Pseudobdellovibrionaceae bacterium]
MNNIKERISMNMKESTLAFTVFLLRLFSGVLLGLSIAVSLEKFMGIGIFSFMFIVILTSMLVLHVPRALGLLGAIIFLLVLVLLGVMLQLYILKAMTN